MMNTITDLAVSTVAPHVTVCRDESGAILSYTVDAQTERGLQKARLFAMLIGGPLVIAGGYAIPKDSLVKRALRQTTIGLGIACIAYHALQYQAVRNVERGAGFL